MSVCMLSQLSRELPCATYGLKPVRLFCPWDSPGESPEVGCHFLLQGIFPTQGSNPGLLRLSTLTGSSLPLVPPGKCKGSRLIQSIFSF